MPNIPPLPTRAQHLVSPPAHADSWVTFNLLFVLAISGLVNVLLVLRLIMLR